MTYTVLLAGKLPPALPDALVHLGLRVDVPGHVGGSGLARADAIVTSSEFGVDDALLAKAPRLRVVGRAASGTDNIDLDACRRRHIAVLHTPHAVAPAAAELTIGIMLAVCRRITYLQQRLKDGVWAKSELQTAELGGRTLGIIGLGRIGSRVATIARAFGMRLVAYDPYIAPRRSRRFGAARAASLDALLAAADIVTIHTPLTAQTRGMIGKAQLDRMKPGAMLLNLARGTIVDETALLAALQSGHLAGAGLDCWAKEPAIGNPLLALDNVVGTPHVGAGTREAKHRITTTIARSIARFLTGLPVSNRLP